MATRKLPSWDAAMTIQKALDALDFATANRADLEPRLGAGLVDGLAADLTAFGVKIPAVIQRRLAAKAATASNRLTATQTKRLVMKMRRALSNAPVGTVDTKAFGLGSRVDERTDKTIIAAGNTITAAAAASPAAVRAAGIIEADLARLASGLTDLSGKNSVQETARRTAKAATRERDATHLRIEQAVRSISSAGDLAYDDDAREALALGLIPEGKKPKKPAAT